MKTQSLGKVSCVFEEQRGRWHLTLAHTLFSLTAPSLLLKARVDKGYPSGVTKEDGDSSSSISRQRRLEGISLKESGCQSSHIPSIM